MENYILCNIEINKKPTVRIIFQGAEKTSKTFLINSFIESQKKIEDKFNNNKNKEIYQPTEECQIYSFSLNVDFDNALYQKNELTTLMMEVIDCPGSNYQKLIEELNNNLIVKLENEIPSNDDIEIVRMEINRIQDESYNNIINFNKEVLNLLENVEILDIAIITFDYSKLWTFQEALL
jgi:hypothetical protein